MDEPGEELWSAKEQPQKWPIKRTNSAHEQPWTPITTVKVTQVLQNLRNWKAIGHDKIPSLWLKSLDSNTQKNSSKIQISGAKDDS